MSGPRKVWYLRRLDLFAALTDAEVADLAALLDDHLLPAGAELLHDRARERVYLVKAGAVRLSAAEAGRRATLALLGPGRLLGLSAAAGDARPGLAAVTLEPTYLCSTTWPRLVEALAQHPPALLRMLRALAEQVFLAETWVARLRAGAPRARLAQVLLELGDEFGAPAARGQVLRFRLTQADLGRLSGLSRETVSRLLADFARAGWVARERGRLVLVDRPALAAAAGGRPGA